MAKVELKGVSFVFEGKRVVDNIDITAEDKEFVTLLSLSHNELDAIMNMIFGQSKITEGTLYIDGELMNDVPRDGRPAALMSSSFPIPFMKSSSNVYETLLVVYSALSRPLDERERLIHETARALNIEKCLNYKFEDLSEEQQLRAAIVGHIVERNQKPTVLLLHNPFSKMDAKLRDRMAGELMSLKRSLAFTTVIYSTDDQLEAMSLGDKVVWLKDGKVLKTRNMGDRQGKQTEERATPAIKFQQAVKPGSGTSDYKASPEKAQAGTVQNTTGSIMSRIPFEAYRGKDPYIFASYAHADSSKVFPILSEFHHTGFPVWYDEGIDPGNEWPEEIANALDKCSLFIVFISASSAVSVNVRNEINLALKRNKTFIAIWLEDAELTPGLELQIGSKQAIMRFRMNTEDFNRKCLQSFGASGIKKTAL